MRRAFPHAAVQAEAAVYQVVDPSGQVFGPVDVQTLRQWAAENRLTPDMMVLDETGAQLAPEELTASAPVADVDVPGYSPEPGSLGKAPRRATLQQRLAAFLVDFTIAFAIFNAIEFMGGMLFLRINGSTNWHIWAYTRYLYPMLFAAYMLGRDALFPGQSIGKRIASIKVLANGYPATLGESIRRNVVWAPTFLLPFRFGPTLGLPLLLLGLIADVALTASTGKGVGDRIWGTKLVQN